MNLDREKAKLHDVLGEPLLQAFVSARAIVAGGAITSLFAGASIRDLDVYFRDGDGLHAVRRFMDDREGWTAVVTTDLAVTYGRGDMAPVQLVCDPQFFAEPDALLRQFDFTVCMGAYDVAAGAFHLGDDFLKHIAQRRLVFRDSAFPICSVARMLKYLKRGYLVSGIEVIKLGLAIQAVRIETYADLRRQLMGIDTLFLREMVDRYKPGQPDAERAYETDAFLAELEEYVSQFPHLSEQEAGA